MADVLSTAEREPALDVMGREIPRPPFKPGDVLGGWKLIDRVEVPRATHQKWIMRCICGSAYVRIVFAVYGRVLGGAFPCCPRCGQLRLWERKKSDECNQKQTQAHGE